MTIMIVISAIAFVPGETYHIGLVEDNAQEVLIDTAGHGEGVLSHLDLGTPPFHDKEETVDEVRHGADVDDRSQR
jgi:hypothetical protein